MSLIEETFRSLKAKREAALIGYVTAGIPSPNQTPLVAEVLVRGGVDILELGVPFSDPIADGPTIQAASHRALNLGVTPFTVFKIVEQIKSRFKIPVVLLTYYNPIYRIGVDRFLETGRSSGVDGLIVPDLPVEEAGEYRASALKHGVDTIFLATPSTSVERLRKIVDATSGFLYLVSLYGVTGARSTVGADTLNLVRRFKPYTAGRTNLAVGFGISRPEHVRGVVEAGADGVIVGSAFVKVTLEERSEDAVLKRLEEFAASLKKPTRLGFTD